ncbi:hypothetical protein [Microbacterium stercoris]|uniref:Uncharacterized protein n=1 Tax=Microbacterium stercoris TaxID=2820289 RepID=A0A939TUC9_9MICO|nr:hypothetical protein [Microbacterium stercoris]MBO3663899.1 hypothetical protein [Microbacterium stercoris]
MPLSDDPRARLAEAERQLAEADRLERLLSTQREELAAAGAAVAEAQRVLGEEAEDVAQLERVSFARAWAALRRDTDERLARERAQEQAARFRLGLAADRLEAAISAVRGTEQDRAALGDVASVHAQAERDVQEWVLRHDGPDAQTLAEVLRRVAVIEAEQKEVGEALRAATAALPPLAHAAKHLSEAGGWATYDTFLDSGLLVDLAKREAMDTASRHLHEADRALRYLSVELGHIGQRASIDLQISADLDAFDLWFDDIFSSWAVRGQIKGAQARVHRARDLVAGIEARLAVQSNELEYALARARTQRAAILRG